MQTYRIAATIIAESADVAEGVIVEGVTFMGNVELVEYEVKVPEGADHA